jgi:hypothetical protein
MTDQEYDTTEKVERTDRGYRLTVESTRGTGTRDQDKVKAELRTEEQPTASEIGNLVADVRMAMDQRRAHQPDEESD